MKGRVQRGFGKVAYYLVCKVLNLVFILFFALKVEGKENIPDQGAFLAIANHQHFLDPVVLAIALQPHRIHFMAKKEIFSNPVFTWVLESLGAFPVKRGKPDRRALMTTIRLLKQGNVVGIFPEGTRQQENENGQAKGGIVQVVRHTGVKILPVHLHLNRWKRPLTVKIGKPFAVANLKDKMNREEVQKTANEIMERVRELHSS